jgi:acyl-CoA thioesterase FadM
MRHGVTGEVSAICVLTGVTIDTQTRKSCPFPAEIIQRARSLVRVYDLPAT